MSRSVDEPPADDASIAGTPAYMAPEQWRGEPEPASDVYSLGCVLYELVTGDARSTARCRELMIAHSSSGRRGRRGCGGGLPIELERLILRALAKDPAMRPTMDEIAGELDELAAADVPLRMAG